MGKKSPLDRVTFELAAQATDFAHTWSLYNQSDDKLETRIWATRLDRIAHKINALRDELLDLMDD